MSDAITVMLYYVFKYCVVHHLHNNSPSRMYKKECDVKTQSQACHLTCFWSLIFEFIHRDSWVIFFTGFVFMSPIPCRRKRTTSCYWKANHILCLESEPHLVYISVGNCSDVYLLLHFRFLQKKFPQVRLIMRSGWNCSCKYELCCRCFSYNLWELKQKHIMRIK